RARWVWPAAVMRAFLIRKKGSCKGECNAYSGLSAALSSPLSPLEMPDDLPVAGKVEDEPRIDHPKARHRNATTIKSGCRLCVARSWIIHLGSVEYVEELPANQCLC